MTDSSPSQPGGALPAEALASQAAKNNTIDLLSEHFAQDNLSLEAFEDRVGKVHRAETMADLQAILGGLSSANVPAKIDGGPSRDLAKPVGAGVSSAMVKPQDRAIAVFSETKRHGQWIPARETQVVAVMGSAVMDLREAVLGPGRSTFKCMAFFGSVEVIVPPGLYVECTGSAVFGSFEQRHGVPTMNEPDAPVVHIEGLAVFGSVEVEVRHPGETRREARKRRRLEKREQRRLRSGR